MRNNMQYMAFVLGCVLLYYALWHYHMQCHCMLKIVLSTISRKTGDKRHETKIRKMRIEQTANAIVSISPY